MIRWGFCILFVCGISVPFSVYAGDGKGVDVGVLANAFNSVRTDGSTYGGGGGGAGALGAWQWNDYMRGDLSFTYGAKYSGNLGLKFKIFSADYKQFSRPMRYIYMVIGIFSQEAWLGISAGTNASLGENSQQGIGAGFTIQTIPMFDVSLIWGMNVYLLSNISGPGLGQAFVGLSYRI